MKKKNEENGKRNDGVEKGGGKDEEREREMN